MTDVFIYLYIVNPTSTAYVTCIMSIIYETYSIHEILQYMQCRDIIYIYIYTHIGICN